MSAAGIETLRMDWGEADKAPADRKRWLGAWLVSRDGEEGDYFYDGPSGQETSHAVPPEAIGFRLVGIQVRARSSSTSFSVLWPVS